jgi:GT2 family glycosyltransferase
VSERPTVAVIVPFAGPDEQLRRCLAGLKRIAMAPGDELVVADNRRRPGGGVPCAGPVRLVAAGGVRAAGFARNRGAEATAAEWLVFLDADTRPSADLLDRYFDPGPAPETAVLAGGIVDVAGGGSAAPRRSARRAQMSQQVTLQRAGRPYAQSANVAIRRHAFAAVGGFDEAARAGEDADLCWRLAAAGWGLETRPEALVEHLTRPTLATLLVQLARHGSGAAWLERRYPGEFAGPDLRGLPRGLAAATDAMARRRPRAAADALLQVAEGCAFDAGRVLLSNRPRRMS